MMDARHRSSASGFTLRATQRMVGDVLADHLRDRLDMPDDEFTDTVALATEYS
ncbi:hypothetical protein [Nocardia thraciensis]